MQKKKILKFEKGEFEIVDKQNLPFKTKGDGGEVVVFKQKGQNNYFAFGREQFESTSRDFLSFCVQEVTKFCKFKYGDNFFEGAKEFHIDLEMNRIEMESKPKTFEEDFSYFEMLSEEEFEFGLGENSLFPALVLQKGNERWKQYEDFTSNNFSDRENSLVLAELRKHKVAVFCIDESGQITLLKHYAELNYNILRGKGEFGNLIEISYGTINLLLDCGKELEENASEESEIEKQVLSKKYDAILISHYHLDHAGLVDKASSPIYMGRGCLKVLNSQIKHKSGQPLKNINCFEPNTEFSIKKGNFEIKIKPILVDHSAYDSYMFLITTDEKSLLYTGDFRANGRKSFAGTLKNLPNKVDYLICEATNMFSERKNVLEEQIERQATSLMKKYQHVFVFQAGTNIDRLVSFYKASRKNKKVFLLDTYVAGITENLPNIPNVKTFKDVYCFWNIPKMGKDFVQKSKQAWRMRKYKKCLGYCEIGNKKNGRGVCLSNFTMLVRPSMLDFLKRVDDDKKVRFNTSIFENSVLIYSLWNGYKEKDDVKNFLREMQNLGVEMIDLHTSGHADKQTIDRLIKKVEPTVIEYVHYIEKTF